MYGLYDSGAAALDAASTLMQSLPHGVSCRDKGRNTKPLAAAAVLLLAAFILWWSNVLGGMRDDL